MHSMIDTTGNGAAGDPMRGQFIQVLSGKAFFLTGPKPEDVNIEDIAGALAKQCRYNGHCLEFYSVAEHCVRVSRIVPEEDRLWALLHDASEAYIGDMVRPLKQIIPQFSAFEASIQRVICDRFGLSHHEPASVRHADNVLLATEKRDLLAEGTRPWGAMPDPLPGYIKPWDWEMAQSLFLDEFRYITNKGV